MNKSELNKLKTKWQTRLKLLDWTVKVRFATEKERKDPKRDWIAVMHPYLDTKTAEIIVLHPKYINVGDRDETDIEVLIAHELVHVHFAPFKTKGALADIEESLVHHLSLLLVALDRKDGSLLGYRLPKVAALHKEGTNVYIEITPEQDLTVEAGQG
jgi:hypothetical protein